MELMNFLNGIPLPVLIAVIVLLALVTVYIGYEYAKEHKLDALRGKVYQLILHAEHTFRESGEGALKLQWVVQQTHELLPAWLKIFVTEKTLSMIINSWFAAVKDLLDDGKVNGSQDTQNENDTADEEAEGPTESE